MPVVAAAMAAGAAADKESQRLIGNDQPLLESMRKGEIIVKSGEISL